MAKVMNPNSVSNMDLINQKAQFKMQQLVQKIGKGKRRVTVTFSKMSRGSVAKMIEEVAVKWNNKRNWHTSCNVKMVQFNKKRII